MFTTRFSFGEGYPTAKQSQSDFRRALAALKKAGIVDVDIQKAKPYWVRSAGPRGGKFTLSELIDKYDDVISKKAAAVRLSPEETKRFKKLKYETTKSGKVIIPHAATEKVIVKNDKIVYEDISGIRRTAIPIEYHNLEQYLRDIKKNKREIKKFENRYFAFRFYGNHSQTYSSIDDLIDDLRKYEAVLATFNRSSSRDANEVYRNLEIVETTKHAWEKSRETTKARAKAARPKTRKHDRAKRLEKLQRGPKWKLDQYRAKRAEQQRQYRLKLTGSALEKYKKAANRRAKKSQEKREK